VSGALVGAAYLLGLYRQMLLGPVVIPGNAKMWDLGKREIICAIPLLIFVFWLGLYPKPFLDMLEPTLQHLLSQTIGTGG
jgi:NADH-quinone oxidoreductase subunit M